jgi:sulfur carrier protein
MNDRQNGTICINGESEPLVASLAELLEAKEIGLDARGVAVALNGALVPRQAWRDTRLAPGDDVEIVRARQGG